MIAEGVISLVSDDSFRMMFYEEARELLATLEEGLVELVGKKDDRAHLDRTFRASHSVKGAAAMVGLPVIAELAHGVEMILDPIRSGQVVPSSEIVATLLEATHHLSAMVESGMAGRPMNTSPQMVERLAALRQKLGEQPAGVEVVLDPIQSGKVAPGAEIVATLLEAADQFSALVESAISGGLITTSPELAKLVDRLTRLLQKLKEQASG